MTSPRLVAEFVFGFLDALSSGHDETSALWAAAAAISGPDSGRLTQAVRENSITDIADNLEHLSREWGAACLASLAFALRLRSNKEIRQGPASNAYLQAQALADAAAPSIESVTAARFVVAVLSLVEGTSADLYEAMVTGASMLDGSGRAEILDAVKPPRWPAVDQERIADALNELAAAWGSVALADLSISIRQHLLTQPTRKHLLSLATAETIAGLATARAASKLSTPATPR